MGTELGTRIRVHALRAGTWPATPEDVTLSESDLAATARAYDPQKFQAPVVIGHPKTDDPAWGWLDSATFGDKGLYVEGSVTDDMAQLVRERRYQTVSLRLWSPAAPGNPAPGVWSIRHLGFLGATPPAVKGLDRTVFASEADGESVEIQLTMDSGQLTADGTWSLSEKNIPLDPPSKGDLPTGAANAMTDEDRKKLEQQTVELAERETTLAAREAAVLKRERDLKRASIGAEIDSHIQAGRVLPVEKDGLVALMERLDEETVCLSEAEPTAAAGGVLRSFLKCLPARVDLKERSAPDGAGGTPAVRMAKAPDGFTLSERSAAVDVKARQLMAANAQLTYVDAVRQVEASA